MNTRDLARVDKYNCSKREKDVFKLILQGLSTKQIGNKLNLRGSTVNCYIRNLHQRFDVSTRSDLILKHFRREIKCEQMF